MVPKGTIQASKRGKQHTVLLSYDAYEPQGYEPQMHDNPKSIVIVSYLDSLTNSSQIAFKTH